MRALADEVSRLSDCEERYAGLQIRNFPPSSRSSLPMNDSAEVKLHFLDYWRVIKLRMGLILLTFFLVVVTAGVTTYFLPKQYFSKVTMEVKPDNSGPVGVFGTQAGRPTYDPQFVATQFQILQKSEILYPVIAQLDLIKEFSPPGQRLPQ